MGGGADCRRQKNPIIQGLQGYQWGTGLLGGAPSSTGTPPCSPLLPPTYKYYQQHKLGSGPSVSGVYGRTESGMDDQALVGSIWRRASIGGSLFLMVAGDLNAKRRRRGDKGREDHEHADKGGGGGSNGFSRGRELETVIW